MNKNINLSSEKYCLLTNDVEEHSIWFNDLRVETGKKVLEEGMPVLLELYLQYGVKSTFFFTGTLAEKFPEIVKMILHDGHEVASHGYSHEIDKAFDVLPYSKQVEHLKTSKKLLESISGQEVISFRAPALRVNNQTPKALIETGFKIDSSIASQRFDMFFSFGSRKKLSWLTAPRLPYYTKPTNLSRNGNGPLFEIPLSAFLFPFTSTTMRIFPKLTSLQKYFFYCESMFTGKPIVFDIHPNEFIDESHHKRIIHRRSKNILTYFLKDYTRSKLKTKNLGISAIFLYKSLIEYFLEKKFKFITLKQYYNQSISN